MYNFFQTTSALELGERCAMLAASPEVPPHLAPIRVQARTVDAQTLKAAKASAGDIKKVKLEIANAYKQYDGAKQMKASLENAEAKLSAAHVQLEKTGIAPSLIPSVANDESHITDEKEVSPAPAPAGNATANATGISGGSPFQNDKATFEINEDEPWNPRLIDAKGNVMPQPVLKPNVKKSAVDKIAEEVMRLPSETVDELHNKALSDRRLKAQLADPEFDTAVFKAIHAKFEMKQFAIQRGVQVQSEELRFKSKAQAEAANAEFALISSPKPKGAKAAALKRMLDVRKEATSKAQEKGIKIDREGVATVARNKKKVEVIKKGKFTPNTNKTLQGAPEGAPQYASFEHPEASALATLAAGAFSNNPQFQEWAHAKPDADAGTAVEQRKQAYEEWTAQQQITGVARIEANILKERLESKARDLVKLTENIISTQAAGNRKFEEAAAPAFARWKRKLKELQLDRVACSRPDCKDDTWKFWMKTEKLITMVHEAQHNFDEWATMVHLGINNPNVYYRADNEQTLWAGLYEAKDDLHRTLSVLQKSVDREKALATLYEDRLSAEMRAKQVESAMSSFPVPETITIPTLIDTANSTSSKVDLVVSTDLWADCQCPLKYNKGTGKLECPFCERNVWEPSNAYKLFGAKSIRTDFDRKQLRWGSLPRHSTVVCDLAPEDSGEAKKCLYKCDWTSHYGRSWFSDQKALECTNKYTRNEKKAERCQYTYISLPLLSGTKQAPGILGGACEMTMSLQALFATNYKQTNGFDKKKVQTGKAGKNSTNATKAAPKPSPKRKLLSTDEPDAMYMGPHVPQNSHHRAQKESFHKREMQTASQEKQINKVFNGEKIDYSYWTGWSCVRQTGVGTVRGYQCSWQDTDVGFLGFKKALRAPGARHKKLGGSTCVKYARVKPESRSICSCCPMFKCERNCQETYDLEARARYDAQLRESCAAKYQGAGAMAADKIASCSLKKHAIKRTWGKEDNVEHDLAKPTPRRAYDSSELDMGEKMLPLPVWKQVKDKFGTNFHKNPAASEWYCKNMWKYSAIDLTKQKPNKLTALHRGFCSKQGSADGKLLEYADAGEVPCEEKMSLKQVVSTDPYQSADVMYVFPTETNVTTKAANGVGVAAAMHPAGVKWPPQSPPLNTWPRAKTSPGTQPNRFSYCTDCCQQLYPKKVGCPAVGRVNTPGDQYKVDGVYTVKTMNKPGEFEWELTGEEEKDAMPVGINKFLKKVEGMAGRDAALDDDKLGESVRDDEKMFGEDDNDAPVSLLQVGERRGDRTENSFEQHATKPYGTNELKWDEGPWGRRRSPLPSIATFARRRRRYFASPVERAAKVAKNAAQTAVDSTTRTLMKSTKDASKIETQKEQALQLARNRGFKRKIQLADEIKAMAAAKGLHPHAVKVLLRKSEYNNREKTDADVAKVEKKWSKQQSDFRARLDKKKLLVNMARNQQKQVLADTLEVRTKQDQKVANADKEAEAFTLKMAADLKKAYIKSKHRWEVIGLGKDRVARLKTKMQKMQLKVDKAEYETKKVAMNLKSITAKVDEGIPIRMKDIKSAARKAVKDIQKTTQRATDAVQGQLNRGWEDLVFKTRIHMFAGEVTNPVVDVRSTLYNLPQEMADQIRKTYNQGQCNAKAVDAYYRLLVEKEVGYADTRGRFFETPKCERLSSIHNPCDSGYVKQCSTVTRNAVNTDPKADYTCEKYSDGEPISLEKFVFCPRITNDIIDRGGTHCKVQRHCSRGEPGGNDAPDRECALF